jgi:aminomethyltransferase
MTEELNRTQLYSWHEKHGDVIPFVGWEMPIRYSDIREEHMAVRDAIGIFDTSHMSRFFIKGPQSTEFLQTLTSNNVSKMRVHGGHYTTCLNEHGGIRDDLILYRISEQEYIWVTNAVNGQKIKKHLHHHAKRFNVKVQDKTKEVTMIAVQGPKAITLLSTIADKDLSKYGRFTCNPVTLAGFNCYFCRSGYTGEDGAEILVLDTPYNEEGKTKAITFWNELLEKGEKHGVKPCGLGARDSTRLEAGMVLYGHEIDEETTPIEARIPFVVKLKVEPHYLGYDIVRKQKKEKIGIKKTRIGLIMEDRGIPREQYSVLYNNEKIGEITSGGLSPILKRGIGMAFVNPEIVTEENIVELDIKGRLRKAKVTSWPFYDTTKYGSQRTVQTED